MKLRALSLQIRYKLITILARWQVHRGPQVKTRDPGPSLISFQTSLGFPTPRSFTSATTYSPSPATLRCKLRSGILRTRNPRRRNLILGPIALLWLRRSLICRFRLRSCIWAIGYWLLIFFLKIWSFYLLKSLIFTSSILWRMIGFLLNRTKTILYMGIGSSSWIFYAETVVVLDWVFLDSFVAFLVVLIMGGGC